MSTIPARIHEIAPWLLLLAGIFRLSIAIDARYEKSTDSRPWITFETERAIDFYDQIADAYNLRLRKPYLV